MAKVYLDRLATSDKMMKVIENHPCEMEVRLYEVLKEKGITPMELHEMTGLRLATISEIGKAKKTSMNLFHLAVIMAALRITDVNELIRVKFDEEEINEWKVEREQFPNGLTPTQQQERKMMLLGEE
ncbi:helix-turn-helix transcriptional regulator [Exiguobacterium marinum]|uniref:Helix-turn-helix transcriptional regulator n=1 Tax=Exiguobacterium marinum TaxID=273528 RepID=A0ABY7X5R0_9BACL|nr:helix-turn-helix transcriptional regulator [Exiguobacterium marinum]WDH76264.1 helix-turn-helix transcriptional regulator [Exiguobacterium marinum]